MENDYYKKLPQGGVASPQGWNASGVACGIKESGRDLGLLYTELPGTAGGVFTSNLFASPTVKLSRERIANRVHAQVVNSGNANACMGEQGYKDVREMAFLAAEHLRVPEESVLVASTGVIGQALPMENVKAGMARAAGELSPEGGIDAANAILTTDTAAKQVAMQVEEEGGSYLVGGMAKGAGMICPNMATMLAFLTTDVQIDRELLQPALQHAADQTFNLITVDGDNSTNDMVIVMANGASGIKINREGPAYQRFCSVLQEACRELSYRIVDDGEGVTKVIALRVKGAPDRGTARTVARAILNSVLVKTAFYGEDANWGRIFMALGNAGVDFNPEKVDLFIGAVQVAAQGRGLSFSEEEAAAVLRCREVPVTLDLNMGQEELLAWGTDLSHDYVSINGSYRS